MTVTTHDRQYAYLKYDEYFKRDPCTKFTRTVTPIDLTGPEQFLYLTYQTMKAIRNYFDNRYSVPKEEAHKMMLESMNLEKQLDLRITEGLFYLQAHPKSQLDEEALTFFLNVESWRKVWKEYFRYKKLKNKDPAVERQLKQQCDDYEIIINKYIVKNIGL